MGIKLASGDAALVRRLGRLRGRGVHTGQLETPAYATYLESLANLLERLLIASALCVYRKQEDGLPHVIDVHSVGPEGGAATVKLDGREVAYEWREEQLPSGEWTRELRVEGRIYDDENSEFRFYSLQKGS